MDDIFRWCVATNIIHGLGSINRLPAEAARLRVSHAFVVCDAGVRKAGVVDEPCQELEKAGVRTTIYDRVPSDPTLNLIDEAAALLRQSGGDGILAVGGGSVIAAAKGIAVVASNGGSVRDYIGDERYNALPLPTIAMPTTAGSGGEVGRNTILTDERSNKKMRISGVMNTPRSAILDATLMRTLPRGQAVASCVDALMHVVEGYTTRGANPITDALALSALTIMGHALKRSILTDDLGARSEQLLASSMANMACGNAGLGLSHALNQSIMYVGKTRGLPLLPYGMLHGVLAPHVLAFNLPASEERFANMALAIGLSPKGRSGLARAFFDWVCDLLEDLDVPKRLPWDSTNAHDVAEVARYTVDLVPCRANPRTASQGDLEQMVWQSIQGSSPRLGAG